MNMQTNDSVYRVAQESALTEQLGELKFSGIFPEI